jgi:hypothetical protein
VQSLRLPLVIPCITFGVIAHQCLGERRVELLDVVLEIVSVLEFKLFLPAFLNWHASNGAVTNGVAQDGRSEFLVDKNAGAVWRNSIGDRCFEPLIDNLLARYDLCCLLGGERFLPLEQFREVRMPVVERKNIEWFVVSVGHDRVSLRAQSLLSPRSRSMSGIDVSVRSSCAVDCG